VMLDIVQRIRARRAGFHSELRTCACTLVWVSRTLAEASWLRRVVRQVERADKDLRIVNIALYVTAQSTWVDAVWVHPSPATDGILPAQASDGDADATAAGVGTGSDVPPDGVVTASNLRTREHGAARPPQGVLVGPHAPTRPQGAHGGGVDAHGSHVRANADSAPMPQQQWTPALLGFERTSITMSRPDWNAILRGVKRDAAGEGSVGIFACGPKPMLAALSSAVRASNASLPGPVLHAFEERF